MILALETAKLIENKLQTEVSEILRKPYASEWNHADVLLQQSFHLHRSYVWYHVEKLYVNRTDLKLQTTCSFIYFVVNFYNQ
jgi:hypothetical protein